MAWCRLWDRENGKCRIWKCRPWKICLLWFFQRDDKNCKGTFQVMRNFLPAIFKIWFIPEECGKHIDRYGKDYFPISLSENMELVRNCGFKAVEILWLSNMQVGIWVSGKACIILCVTVWSKATKDEIEYVLTGKDRFKARGSKWNDGMLRI